MQKEIAKNGICGKIKGGGYVLCVTACLCLAHGAAAFESGTFAEVHTASDRYKIASGGNNNPFSGWIDEVRITRGVLTPEEFIFMGRRRGSALTFR